ncbi:putative sterigmatocystin biosynthesis monooxygenase stcW [Neonectria ditissima]|uniref:Putative sterigmatocystin biosynthesis monooxygenase stcW n=1 Tax=Neonectria ditissima TaxID=78410 RepID=A0A0P7BWV9_9HYPO|nr:putative sterigmatocystin biosynthesis monooxygenase stcW [Neonectria ditissima]
MSYTNSDAGCANGKTDTSYEIGNHFHSEPTKPIKIICVGSGISGLCLAFKLCRRLESFELAIYEKNPDIGGTWYENRYPGCACDIPAHLYTFSWAPKADWSKYYADSAEIEAYCKEFFHEHGLERFTHLQHRVKEAVWDEESGKWSVQIEDLATGVCKLDKSEILVNATGFLNKWKWPDIEGLESFKQPKVHSAAWDDSIDFEDKAIGVIGTGSSAIQIIPQMQPVAKRLKVFMRSPTWITTAIGGQVSSQFRGQQDEDTQGHKQFIFSDEQKERFRQDPEYHLDFRKRIEAEVNWMADIFNMGTEMQVQTQASMREQMKKRIGEENSELAEKLIPTWPPGCRRLTPGDRYLESLVQDNAEPIFGSIKKIDESAILMEDGTRYELDVLICATGFDVSFVPSFQITGRNGLTMSDVWKDEPDAYLGLAAPNFPNYFVVCGPQGPLGNGSILPAIEVICDYIIEVAAKMQAERIHSVVPKRHAATQFQEHMRKFHAKTVWTQPCRSWYKTGKVDGLPQLWCGTALSYIKTIRTPRFEDYDIKYMGPNQWAFLGNGKLKAHNPLPDGSVDIDGLAPYIRNGETPWDI